MRAASRSGLVEFCVARGTVSFSLAYYVVNTAWRSSTAYWASRLCIRAKVCAFSSTPSARIARGFWKGMGKNRWCGAYCPVNSLASANLPTFATKTDPSTTTQTSPNAAWFGAYEPTPGRFSRGESIAPLSPKLTPEKLYVLGQPLSSLGSPASAHELGNSTLLFDSPRSTQADFTSTPPAGPSSFFPQRGPASGPTQTAGLTAFSSPGPQDINCSFRAPSNMAIEREPPKTSLSPGKDNQRPHQPEFGSPSPLRSTLPKVFNIPRKDKPRPEHHRPSNSGVGADGKLRKYRTESTIHPSNERPDPPPSSSGISADGELRKRSAKSPCRTITPKLADLLDRPPTPP